MSIKEKIAGATNSGSLKWVKSDEEESERAVDRLTALGLAQVRVEGIGVGESPANALLYGRTTVRESDHLAALLWKWKYGGDRSWATYQQVSHGVTARVHGRSNRRSPSELMRAVVAIALEEWRVETCPTCRGRKFVGGVYDPPGRSQESRARPCGTCDGAGQIERTAQQRAQAVSNLLRMAEAERQRRSLRLVSPSLVVSARAAPLNNVQRLWEHGWGEKYQKAMDIIVALDARLGGKIRRRLEEPE